MKIVRNLLIGVLLLGGAVCGFAQRTVAYIDNPAITHAMKNQGTYASGTTYASNDVVISSGVSYLSLSAGNVGHTPSSSATFWQPLGSASSLVIGTTSGTAAEGNDSRIVGAQQAAAKGAASGYAGLDSSSHLLAVNEPAHTGDVTSPAGSTVNTLATVNSNVGACGDATHVGQVTLDAKGRATGCAQVAITAASDFVGSGTGHAHGLVPDPGASSGNSKYLREDGTWVIPTSTTGLGDPGANGLVKRTALGVTQPATASDVQDILSSDTSHNSEIYGSQAGGGADVVANGPAANHGVFVFKNNEWEGSNNGDTLSKFFRQSDFTATAINTAIKTLTGCSTDTFLYNPSTGTCVAPSGGSSGPSMIIPRDINVHYEAAPANGTGFSQFSIYTNNSVGAASAVTSLDAAGYRSVSFTTGTTINTSVGRVSTADVLATNPSFRAIFHLQSAANVNAWVGLCSFCNVSIAGTLNQATTGNTAFVGFRHFSGTEATNWTCYAGSGSASNTADSGVAVDVAKMQVFDVIYVVGVPQFYINTARVCSGIVTSALPSATTNLGAAAVWQNTTTTPVLANEYELYFGAN